MRISDWSSDVCSSDLGEVTSVHAKVIYQARVAERDPPAFNRADDPLAGGRIEVFGIRELEFALFRRLDDGGCKRVLARSLQTGSDSQELVLADLVAVLDGNDPRLALRQRPGLVDDQLTDILAPPHGPRILQNHTR